MNKDLIASYLGNKTANADVLADLINILRTGKNKKHINNFIDACKKANNMVVEYYKEGIFYIDLYFANKPHPRKFEMSYNFVDISEVGGGEQYEMFGQNALNTLKNLKL